MNAVMLERPERELHPFMSAASRAFAVVIGLALIVASLAYVADWMYRTGMRSTDLFALVREAVIAPAFGIFLGFTLVFFDGKD